jgi:glycosyltransferase involved in cell wall biosynthesis
MISLIVPVMNRSDRVIPCLETWINQPQINEILIVDWSSTVPIKTDPDLTPITNHNKTKIVRVNDEKSFMSMSFSLNVALNYAKYDHILKCDIDYKLINPELLNMFQIDENNFYCGTVRNKWDFHGFSFFKKEDAIKINGYNEKFRGWGWDDEDFYRRLEKIGLERIIIMEIDDFLYHIPHEDSLRTANYPEKLKYKTNRQNAIISSEEDVGQISKYTTIKEEPNYIELIRL